MEDHKEKIGAWAIVWKQIKTYAVSVIAGATTVSAFALVYLNDAIDERIQHHDIELEKENRPLRDIISEELTIPVEIVPYFMSNKFIQVDSLTLQIERFNTIYLPVIRRQMEITPIYRFLDENGEEKWNGPDGREYRVNKDGGTPWVVYHGHRKDI